MIDVNESPKTECPAEFTGQIPYALDCRQYLNCWNGRGTIQSCSPGTHFNPRTKECDHPSKVKCQRFEGFTSRQLSNRQPHSQRQEFAPIKCENGVSGLFGHPLDCTKFLNCDHGRTFIQSCGPGTAFNDVFKVCDWPHKVDCGTRPFGDDSNGNGNRNGNGNGNGYPNGKIDTFDESSEGFNGEGMMDVRFSEPAAQASKAHSVQYPFTDGRNQNQNSRQDQQQNQNHYPGQNSRQYPHQNQYPQQNQHQYPHQNQNQYPHQDPRQNQYSPQSQRPPQNQYPYSNTPQIQFPQPNAHNHRQFQQPNAQRQPYPDIYSSPTTPVHQSNNGINSLSNSYPSSIDATNRDAFSSSSSPHPASNIDSTLEILDQTHQESSPNTQFIKIPDQILLPPFEDNKTESGNRAGRIGENFQGNPNQVSEWEQREIETNFTDTIPLIRNNAALAPLNPPTTTPQNVPSQQFPGINYMSTRVVDDFNKYFANPQSKTPPKVPPPPQTTTERQSTKVYSIYPVGFETMGANCEENGSGLNEHPYDCSRYVNCENGQIQVQSCHPGFMFNPILKICEFGYKCESGGSQSGTNPTEQYPSSRLPDEFDEVNEIHHDENDRKSVGFDHTTPTQFGLPQTTPSTQQNQRPYYIPDMSVLPLENGRYPQNTYPERSNTYPEQPKWTYSGPKPSHGGDIPSDDFEPRIGLESPQIAIDRTGKTLNSVPPTTEKSPNVMRIPSGKEHVMPIYQRPTRVPVTTTSTTSKNFGPLQSYNQIYYQPFAQPPNQTQEKDETDYIPISEALKYLLRPYITRNDTKAANNSEHMNQIEDKLLDMIDDGSPKTRTKPLEQDSLAAALLNENISVQNLPESPRFSGRTDIETFATTERQNQLPPATYFQPNHNSPHSNSDSNHSPAFNTKQNQPQYYKPGTNEPVHITFPGPHSQSHPMHGYYHQNPPLTAPLHNIPQSQNYHNDHHPHFGPNYHANVNNRDIEHTTPTTASAPAPNSISNIDKPTTAVRFGKSQYAEVSHCHEQFDCGTGFCISFDQVGLLSFFK